MAELLDQYGNSIPGIPENVPDAGNSDTVIPGIPAVIIRKPFNLSDPQWNESLDKLAGEVLEKESMWESKMTTLFGEWEEYTDNWRIRTRKASSRPKGIFNSKSGETHRAVETLATLWFRMLTAADPFYEAVGEGLDDFGNELSEAELYAAEAVRRKHLQRIKFKEKLLRGMRSLSLFGSVIFECPYISFPYGDGEKVFEGTDLIPRSLLTTGFNPFVFDLDWSDYIFTLDYPTVWMLKNWSSQDSGSWRKDEIEKVFQEHKDSNSASNSKTAIFNRVMQRKQRAGYNALDSNSWELISYHGRIDTNLDVVQAYWQDQQRQDDPDYCDFSLGVLHGQSVVKFHATPFKTWRHLFKTAHYKLFELEPLGYGVGKIGRKRQEEIDSTESRANDLLMMSLLSMWKIGKYAGLDVSQLTIKPWQFVMMEDITQLEPIRPQIEALASAINMQGMWKEDFRTTTGATTNLQAQNTGATATESTITQNEAIRGGSVHAEIIADTFLRDFLETSHVNDVHFMEQGMWVKITGYNKPMFINRDNLPVNVGFISKVTTDKDFRPERLQRIEALLNLATSIRNIWPEGLNAVQSLAEEFFRGLGMNPRLLQKPMPIYDQLSMAVQRAQRQQQFPQLWNETQAEIGGAAAGSGPGTAQTPLGPVPTSPLPSRAVQMSA